MSLVYGIGTKLRNTLYNKRWLTSKSYPLPVICVGNLAVGGTGKTPHTEYLINLLQTEGLQVATLSRGYKRHTKGYLRATDESTVSDIGDEPWQLFHNHPDIIVAVDEDRCHGIEQLLQEPTKVDAILLDDAFQHRAVSAGLNILLTDYHRLYTRDMLLPAGRLRESKTGAQRAHIVVVTKCPADLYKAEADAIREELRLLPHQQLFFSTITYAEPQPVFDAAPWPCIDDTYELLAITGIAHPEPMIDYLHSLTPHVVHLSYADHHDFTATDLQHLQTKFAQLPGKKLIITTQKDAARLQGLASQLAPAFQQHLYALPILVEFIHEQQAAFDQSVINYLKQ
ncbi:MAG: tetraacyldisaccharide 4'-kinase [Bacteroidaceae bacterium]|nr:tetraacyldisaccharide 4'-kinase [Bacteroidaceae bacterium]